MQHCCTWGNIGGSMGEFREMLKEAETKSNEQKFWRELQNKVDKETFQEIRDYYVANCDRSVFDNYAYAQFKKDIYKKFNIK